MNLSKKIQKPSVLSFIINVSWPYKWFLIGQALALCSWSAYVSLSSYLLRKIITIINTQPHLLAVEQVGNYVWSYFWLVVGIIAAYRFHGLLHLLSIPKIEESIVNQVTAHLLRHRYQFYQEHFAGSLANQVRMITMQVPKILETVFDKLLKPFVTVVIAWWTVSQVSIQFTLLWIAWFIIFMGQALFVSRKLGKRAHDVALVANKVVGYVVDSISNILPIHAFATQQQELHRIQEKTREWVYLEQKRLLFFLKFFSLQGLLNIISVGLNLWLLMRGLAQGTLGAGDFALILMINESIGNMTWRISQDLALLFEMIGIVSQGLETIQIAHLPIPTISSESLVVSKGTIIYENVSFHYEHKPVLFNNLSVIIPGGQRVGLVGFSGSGKSTFINLLLRLFDIQSGTISIDGQPISLTDRASLSKAISFIPQDPSLFHRTLYENIKYAKPEATHEEIIMAAQQAHVHEFAMQLEQGYQTMVGDRGIKLSGGQRQRIAIARAFLKNAPILLLDEATSQLDSITESYIQHSLLQLMHNKTVLIIAHRLSTILHMDRILVFDQGTIVQDGTHSQLLEQEGLYTTLWNHQSGGFLPEKQEVINLQL